MIPRIREFRPLPNLLLRVSFDDGRVVDYDVGEDVDSIPAFAPLRTQAGLFAQAQLDQSRTCVSWDEWIDLPSDTIYEFGREVVPAI
ncbi:MAG: DUF2442 domain-containing protein [Eggerthellaceae bacterium]|nr:DUF2442 domain-containing protein [Eggerthellaceae bacterium]